MSEEINIAPGLDDIIGEMIARGYDTEATLLPTAWRPEQFPGVKARIAELIAEGQIVLREGRYSLPDEQ